MIWFAHNWIFIIVLELYSIFLHFAINKMQYLEEFGPLHRGLKVIYLE